MARSALLALVLSACGAAPPSAATPAAPAAWTAWRARRHESLAGEDGWLTLVALTWLEPGETTIGADPSSGCVLPAGHAPARVGRAILDPETRAVRFVAEPGVEVTVDGAPVTEIELAADVTGSPTRLSVGPIRIHLLQRGDRLGLRVKDRESPARVGFTGPDVFDYDPSFRIAAHFEPATGETIGIVNVLGMTEDQPVLGRLRFELGGRTFSLLAIAGGDTPEDALFVMARDLTSGETTYGAGRYLDVHAPDESGETVLDFNFLETPPCAYTELATCPLPPMENELDVEIRAGELAPAGHR